MKNLLARTAALLARLTPYKKAVGALLAPAAVILGAALLPGSDGGSAITQAELGTALTAALGAAGVVYKVRNGRLTVDVDLAKAREVEERLLKPKAVPPYARNNRRD